MENRKFRQLSPEEMPEPPTEEQEEWITQIRDLSVKAKDWSMHHPEANPQVQFNWPAECMLVASVDAAVEEGLIIANAEGKEMLTAMGAFEDSRKQPTAFMVRMALSYMDEIAKAEGMLGNQCPYCQYITTFTKAITGPDAPVPGALSICTKCANIAMFDENLKLRMPTASELEGLTNSNVWGKIEEAQRLIRERAK